MGLKFFKKGGLKATKIKDPSRVRYDLKKCEIFRDVPEESVREVVAHMKQIDGKPGDVVIRQGDMGDFYYVLLKGKAGVYRRSGEDGKPEKVAELTDGAGFGEEALISGAKRNATVELESESLLVQLPKEPFIDYIEKSLVRWLTGPEAQEAVKTGARWVDVRDPGPTGRIQVANSMTIPLAQLRVRLDELDNMTLYICYCDDGRLSATAAFLLRQQRFDVAALRGGLRSGREE